MKHLAKILAIATSILGIIVGGFLAYFLTKFPQVSPPSDVKIEATPERVERGKYLARHVTGCLDCHGGRDWNRYAAPLIPGTEGKGGELFGQVIGLPGDFYSKNITPAGIKDWTDGELLRAITAGVSRDGTTLFPIMPFPNFAQLSREDVYSVIAYIRTLPVVENMVPASKAIFPVSLLMRMTPKDPVFPERPNPADTVAYGRYITTAANCADCHTPKEKGADIPGMAFAGGMAFPLPQGTARSANITPDLDTGIGWMKKENFIARFRTFDPATYEAPAVTKGQPNTIMPWTLFAGMTDQDLGAIYDYLRTVAPVKNKVEKFTP